jgi:hypothetical protein
MALLLTSVFGVTGCGSDDDVDVESRVKNVAPEASGVSGAPSKADCDRLDRLDLSDLRDRLDRLDLSDLRDLLDRGLVVDLSDLRDRLDRLDLRFLVDLLDRDLDDLDVLRDRLDRDLDDLRGILDRLDQCDAASDSGATAPKGDDVDRG